MIPWMRGPVTSTSQILHEWRSISSGPVFACLDLFWYNINPYSLDAWTYHFDITDFSYEVQNDIFKRQDGALHGEGVNIMFGIGKGVFTYIMGIKAYSTLLEKKKSHANPCVFVALFKF